jgi:hypothetical protein
MGNFNDSSNKATINDWEVAAWLLCCGYSTHGWKCYELGRQAVVLEARRPFFKNSEKSKSNLTGDVDPSLHTENLRFTGHNYHFSWPGLTIESPSRGHGGARMQWL